MSPWELFSIVWIVMWLFTSGAIGGWFTIKDNASTYEFLVITIMSIVFWPFVLGLIVSVWITGSRD